MWVQVPPSAHETREDAGLFVYLNPDPLTFDPLERDKGNSFAAGDMGDQWYNSE